MHYCKISALAPEARKRRRQGSNGGAKRRSSLTDDPELGIVQHDLFLTIVLKFNGGDGVVF